MRWSVKFSLRICFILFPLAYASANSGAEAKKISPAAIIREINMARQTPVLYAAYVDELRRHCDGHDVVLPGEQRWRLKEGAAAIDEAARFLRAVRPEPPLILSPGMSRAAADHCADQAGGRTGHGGSDRSTSGSRLSRYGIRTGEWGEDIAYGKTNARQIVLVLIIDDGQPGRPHRKNIFDSNFHSAGAACGPHRRYGTVCTINFAGKYVERER